MFNSIPSFDYYNQNHVVFVLLAIIIISLGSIIIRYRLKEYIKAKRFRKRVERGNKLEVQARKFLKSKGYSIQEYQSTYTHCYTVNDEVQTSEIQPDYIVKKHGKTYIVEVKSGHLATNPSNRNTRRQLLEYDYVVENDGVFLLDMENRELKLVQFKTKAEKHSVRLLKTVIIVALVAIAIPYWQIKLALALVLGFILISKTFR